MAFDLESTILVVLFFILGAAVGSFLNVCVWRMPRQESLAQPPSHCPNCDHRLKIWPDMVPLFSQLFYRSRCRYCGERFSWRYFWIEVITGLCFVAVGLRFWGDAWQLVPNLVFVSALLAIAFIDLAHFIVLDQLVWVALGAGILKDGALILQGQHERLWREIPGIAMRLPIPASVWGAALSFWLLWQLAALASAAVKQEA